MNSSLLINCDADRVAVAGDSAGGNLAAVVAMMARDSGDRAPIFQLLVYPVTDYYLPGNASYEENADGYFLTRDDMAWFWNHYLSDQGRRGQPIRVPVASGKSWRLAIDAGDPAELIRFAMREKCTPPGARCGGKRSISPLRRDDSRLLQYGRGPGAG